MLKKPPQGRLEKWALIKYVVAKPDQGGKLARMNLYYIPHSSFSSLKEKCPSVWLVGSG